MTHYKITGMSCAACSARVEKAVLGVKGVESCSVSLLTNSMGVIGTASENDIINAVKKAGYGAELIGSETKSVPKDDLFEDKETPKLKSRLILSLIFLIILMYFSMGHSMLNLPLPPFFEENAVGVGLIQLLLTTVIMIINKKFFVSGFKSLFKKAPNMDTLVALGASAAFIYSTVILFLMTDTRLAGNLNRQMDYMHGLYFESAAMILTLITLGKMLEARSKGKTTNALKGLINLAPKQAIIISDGIEKEISASEIKVGDIFIVKSGMSIPADGIVIEGTGAVNESSLTGESIPTDKAAGDTVSAATINQSGFLKCRATKVGDDTVLSQIIKMVENAAATKAPIAKAADKVSGIFVPVVILISVISTFIWCFVTKNVGFSLARGISVLVISCPCALGLATPVAIMVANGVGAKNGILFKNAASLEETGKIKIVALDKTGTITTGEPKVTDIIPLASKTESELLALSYSLELKSEHPLAKAICVYAKDKGISQTESTDFEVYPGNGLSALIDNKEVFGGNLDFILKNTVVTEEIKNIYESLTSDGKTPLFFSEGGELCGIIAVSDTVKDDSKNAVSELKSMGIKVVMLTGDNERTAKSVQAVTGVDKVIAGVLPSQKENVIQSLKKEGKTAMVGDGINDAPALTSADIGIAIGKGTDIAIDSSDIVLMKNSLSDVVKAIRLSKAALRNIHENLFWAFVYNALGIPLAAGVFIPFGGFQLNPMFAALAMSLSSFSVVTNALRLNFVNIKSKHNIKEQKIMEKRINIEGMMCSHCEERVKKCLEKIDGVTEAIVSHEKNLATVKLSKDVPFDTLKDAVENEGYKVII